MTEIKNLYKTIDIEKEAIGKYKPEILKMTKYISDFDRDIKKLLENKK